MESAPEGFTSLGRKGDLDVYMTNIEFPGGEGAEPALYIRNPHRKDPTTGGCPVYMVILQDLWHYRPEDRDRGRNHEYGELNGRLSNGCEALYGLVTNAGKFRILDAILEFVDDLKNLRPPPDMTREQYLNRLQAHGVTLKIDGVQVI